MILFLKRLYLTTPQWRIDFQILIQVINFPLLLELISAKILNELNVEECKTNISRTESKQSILYNFSLTNVSWTLNRCVK